MPPPVEVIQLTGRAEARALAVFLGPYDYLSPDDYVTGGGSPASNYVAVHAARTPHALAHDEQRHPLRALAVTGEARRTAVTRWTLDQAPAGLLNDLLPHIRFFRIDVSWLQAVFKLSQGLDLADIQAQIRALRQQPTGASWDLANLMAIAHRHDDARDVGQLDRDRFGGHVG